jgi:hypothetical protein
VNRQPIEAKEVAMRKLAKLIITIFAIFALASVPALEADAFPDSDGDGIRNAIDNCVWTFNGGQIDDDTDGRGNECDNCVSNTNSNQRDSDDDGDGNECDTVPYPPAPPCGAIQGTSNGSKQYEPGGPWLPDVEMLSFHIHTMITPSGDILPEDPDPQYDDSMLFVFGLFDTGSTLVLLHPGSAGYLGYDTVNRPLVNFGVWGTQAIDPATVSAPYRYPEVEIPNVKPRFEGNPNVPTLLGAPIANNVIAWIDYTSIIERVINPTWTERNPAMSFFEPDDPGIPTPLFWVELQQTETPFPPNDEATVGPRYLIPNMRFIREGHIAEGSDFTLMIDTGNTATQIGQNLAAALGIDAFTPVDDTIRRDGRDIPGYRISRVILDDMAGEKQYLISDPLVFVVPDISVRGVDANIGSNYFETTQVLIDGPGSKLGLYTALCPGEDAIPPSCDLTTTNVGPPVSIEITVQDMESGLSSISVDSTVNATVDIPEFEVETTDPVIVTATSTATGQESSVTLRITDVAGNIRICQHSLTSPRCSFKSHNRQVNAYIEIEVQDHETGLVSIAVTGGQNVGSGTWPVFDSGTNDPVIVQVVVDDNTKPASVTLRITDVAGNVTTCEHIFNEPPDCDAGTYSPVECTGATTQVTLDGSGSEDPYGDELTFEWTGDFIEQTASTETPPVTFEGSGDFSVNLSVRVPYFFPEATCEAIVPVVDTTPPELTAPPNVTAECISDTSTPVELGEPTVFDVCDENVTVTNDSPTEFELGERIVQWTATDSSGNSSTATQSVTVVDTTPPTLQLSVTPDVLWPPNHKMVPISVTIDAADSCDSSDPYVELISVTMNEGDETISFDEIFDSTVGDGHTVGDIQVGSNGEVSLRAERSGKGDGRIYTITYIATDGSGNSTTASAKVTVPHNQ